MKRLSILTTFCLLLLAVSLVTAQDSIFEEGSCPMGIPEGATVTCGYLTVPENRAVDDSNLIRLAVAIVHHPDPVADDPIIYFEGGPGGSSLEQFELSYQLLFQEIHMASGRDMIFFDQRGVGFSEPALDCEAHNDLQLELIDYEMDGEVLDYDQVVTLLNNELIACGEDFSETIDLGGYNTVENAADVETLRIALGYEEWNVFGISYGTQLGLVYMRDYPDAIRSVVLDSLVPLEIDFYAEALVNGQGAFDVLFQACANDAGCNEAYPELEMVFWDLVDQFNETPITVEATNPNNLRTYDAVFDGDTMINWLFQWLYQTDLLPYLPQYIYDIRDGDYATIQGLFSILISQLDAISLGMNLAFNCQDEWVFSGVDELEAVIEANPRFENIIRYSATGLTATELCPVFSSTNRVTDVDNEPVISDLPTLVISGEYDPITPPRYGDIVGANLSNSTTFTLPGTGHGGSVSDECPIGIVAEFWADPSADVDTSCVAEIDKPQFILPDTPPPAVTLIESTLDNGIELLLPDGWLEIQANTFVRQSNPLDQTALLFLGDLPVGNVQALVTTFALGLGSPAPEQADTFIADNELEWGIFPIEIQGFPGMIIAAENGEAVTGIILITNTDDELTYLYDELITPILQSYPASE